MFRIVFSCKRCNIQGLVGVISKYCLSKGFDNYLVSDCEFIHSYGVGVRIALSQKKYKTLCPDEVRNDIIHLVTKKYKSSHLLLYVIKDTKLFNSL